MDPGVTPICGADGCRILCDQSDMKPNVDMITCVNRKLVPSPSKTRRIGCAQTASMFSAKCGAISQNIGFPDLDKMTIFCTTTKCSIAPLAEYASTCEPSIKSSARATPLTTIMMSSDVNPKNPPSNVAPFSLLSPRPTETVSSPSAPALSASSPSPVLPSSSHQWLSVPVTAGSLPPMRSSPNQQR